jgi:hypothetical protein
MIRTFSTKTKVVFPLLVLVSLTSFLQAQAPVITCPGTTVTYGDPSNNDAQLWNAAQYWDHIIGSHDLAENAVPLEINITDNCTTGALKAKYILYLDLDYNGSQETRVDSDTLPAANTIHYNNKNLAVTAGTQWQFDFRPVPAAEKFGFDLLINTISPTQTKAQLVWRSSPTATTLAQLPYGTHRIKWIVTNGCGEQSTCEYTFIVRDEKPPTVVSIDNLSANLMNINGGLVQVWATDFLQSADDNYTPSSQIKIGIRKQGTGSGFPYNLDGTPQTGIQFTCDELGANMVELWALDAGGNISFDSTSILVADNMQICNNTLCDLKMFIGTEYGGQIEDLTISFVEPSGIPNIYPPIAPSPFNNSCYSINTALGFLPAPDVRIRPENDLDPLNGVNTWDLILIRRHILAVEPFDSPYKLIAADANKSGTITAFDQLELRKLILGTYYKLPANSSWRFVDKNQVFSDSLNPFTDVFRESLPYGQWSLQGIPLEFIGIKVGDVDNTATPNNLTAEVEDRNTPTTEFHFKDQILSPLETITLHFAPESNIDGYQMALDLSQFDLLEITPQNGLTMDNFGVFEQAITMVAERPNQGFDLRLRAKQAGQLSNMLGIKDDITRTMAFTTAGKKANIALRFDPIDSDVPQLYPILPNPWNERTNISFYLPEDGTAVLTVVDGMGRTIYRQNTVYNKGHQSIRLDHTQIPTTGLYWLVLETGSGKLVQKMVKNGY